MFNLPQVTEISRPLPKKSIYEKFGVKASQQKSLDADVSRMIISHVLSPHSLPSVAEGKKVKSIYVIWVQLKKKHYSAKNIEFLSHLIPQKILFAMQLGNEVQLAVYHSRLFTSAWSNLEETLIPLSGLDFDTVWENIVATIGDVNRTDSCNLDEQIEADLKRQQVELKVTQLEKQARTEKQPRRKWDLVSEMRRLEKSLEN